MTEQDSLTLLSGWIDPAECYFRTDNLYLLVFGTFAGTEAKIEVCLVDAPYHGYSEVPDDLITRAFGNWVELAGTFQASPISDDDNPDHGGYLTIASVRFSTRPDADPRLELSRDLALKTLTAKFPSSNRGSAGRADGPRLEPQRSPAGEVARTW